MVKKINLALQGGGAHGAFTWGVLDRFLDEEDIEISAISGTSAGALNGAAYKAGWHQGQRDGARDMLNWLWSEVGKISDLGMPEWMSAWMPSPALTSLALDYSPALALSDSFSRMVSPYAWGAFYNNPLKRVVDRFDFEGVCGDDGPRLFVCATAVRDGKVRIFTKENITTDAILASACLPTMFQAVKTTDPLTGKEEAFWDGGYSGNPALFPLYDKELPDDVVVVNINPLIREDLPTTPQEIQNRINEISFNSALLKELRAIEFVQRLIDHGQVQKGAMKNVLVHMIADDDLMNDLSVSTKLVPLAGLIEQLKQAGRNAADQFIASHKSDLNVTQTADLQAMFG